MPDVKMEKQGPDGRTRRWGKADRLCRLANMGPATTRRGLFSKFSENYAAGGVRSANNLA